MIVITNGTFAALSTGFTTMGAGLEAGGGALLAEVTTDQEINSGITEQEEPIEIPRGPDDNSKLY